MDGNAGGRVGNKSRANTDLSRVTSSAGTAFVVSFEEENMAPGRKRPTGDRITAAFSKCPGAQSAKLGRHVGGTSRTEGESAKSNLEGEA